MTKLALTLDDIRKLGACDSALKRVRYRFIGQKGHIRARFGSHSAADAVEAGCELADLIWVAERLASDDSNIRRRLRLWATDCAIRVLPIIEAACPSTAPRDFILAVRRVAHRSIGRQEYWDARNAANNMAVEIGLANGPKAAARAIASCGRFDEINCCTRMAQRAIWWETGDRHCEKAEKRWQLDRFVTWMSDPEPAPLPLPDRVPMPGEAQPVAAND